MVNYTLGEGFKKLTEFEVKYNTGDVCIMGSLDYEVRNSYEFPIIATDRGMWIFYSYIIYASATRFFNDIYKFKKFMLFFSFKFSYEFRYSKTKFISN